MLDAGFTYGGDLLGIAAIVLWVWLAAAAALPGLHRLVARYEDDLQLGHRPTAWRPKFGWLTQLSRPQQAAFALTFVALVCQSIGFAIPD